MPQLIPDGLEPTNMIPVDRTKGGTRIIEIGTSNDGALPETLQLDTKSHPEATPPVETIQASARQKTKVAELPGLNEKQREVLLALYPKGWETPLQQRPGTNNCAFVTALCAARRSPIWPYIVVSTFIRRDEHRFRAELLVSNSTPFELDTNIHTQPQVIHGKNGPRTLQRIGGEVGDMLFEETAARQNMWIERLTHGLDPSNGTVNPTALDISTVQDALEMLLGRYAYVSEFSTDSGKTFAEGNGQLVLWIRDRFNAMTESPHEFIAVASINRGKETEYCIEDEETGTKDYYMDPDYFFMQGHAYTVLKVDSKAGTVLIANTGNTHDDRKTISFDTFNEYFGTLAVAQLLPQRLKRDFGTSDCLKVKEHQTREGIYSVPLLVNDDYSFEAPDVAEKEFMQIKLRDDLSILVRGDADNYRLFVVYEDDVYTATAPEAKRLGLLKPNERVEIGKKELAKIGLDARALRGIEDAHLTLELVVEESTDDEDSEPRIELCGRIPENPIIAEGREFSSEEPLSTVAQPGLYNGYVLPKGAVRQYEVQESRDLSLKFLMPTENRQQGTPEFSVAPNPTIVVSITGKRLIVTVEQKGKAGIVLDTLMPGDMLDVGSQHSHIAALMEPYIAAAQFVITYGRDGKVYIQDHGKYGTCAS